MNSLLPVIDSGSCQKRRGPLCRWMYVRQRPSGDRFSVRTPTDLAFRCRTAATSMGGGLPRSPRWRQPARTRPDHLPSVQTLDQASLDRFTTDLIEAGFHAVAKTDHRDWEGPALY